MYPDIDDSEAARRFERQFAAARQDGRDHVETSDEEDEMDLVELREAHTADNQPIADMRVLSEDEKIAAITKANAMALERARTFGKRDRE